MHKDSLKNIKSKWGRSQKSKLRKELAKLEAELKEKIEAKVEINT
jgi:hypothetical protein